MFLFPSKNTEMISATLYESFSCFLPWLRIRYAKFTLCCKVANSKVVKNQIHFDPFLHNRPNKGDGFYISLWSDRKYWTFSNNSNSKILAMKAYKSWWVLFAFFFFSPSLVQYLTEKLSVLYFDKKISASPDCEMLENQIRLHLFSFTLYQHVVLNRKSRL